MKIITPGHVYDLENFDNKDTFQTVSFISKVPTSPGSSVLETVADGTTNEEVLAMLIDRVKYLNTRMSCRENSIVITKLEEALMWLNKRTSERMEKGIEGAANVN